MSTDNQITAIVDQAEAGTIFFPEDFSETGSQGAIHTALHRLVKKNQLIRVAQGIYAKPQISHLLNQEVLPSLDKIAKAIAKRDKAKLLPSGSYAMHALGLSTQIPLKLVYYTDGKARKIKIGNATIQFRKTTPKKLAMKGPISKLVVQALIEIGNGKVSPNQETKIIELLKKENIEDLKHDINLAPQWVGEIMAKALRK